MKSIQQYLLTKQAEFSQHAFFERLGRRAPLREVLPFAKAMTFWIMSFQDILRLNAARVSDGMLKTIAEGHKREDAGHDLWFLSDLLHLEGELPDVSFLFSTSHAGMRDASYALVSEVFQARSDVERIALVLALESTGHIFFERISSYLEGSEFPLYEKFRYFARKHLNVELDHEVFEEEKEQYLENLQMTEAEEHSCRELVDRAYVAFTAMFDHVEQAVRRNQSQFPAYYKPTQQPGADATLVA